MSHQHIPRGSRPIAVKRLTGDLAASAANRKEFSPYGRPSTSPVRRSMPDPVLEVPRKQPKPTAVRGHDYASRQEALDAVRARLALAKSAKRSASVGGHGASLQSKEHDRRDLEDILEPTPARRHPTHGSVQYPFSVSSSAKAGPSRDPTNSPSRHAHSRWAGMDRSVASPSRSVPAQPSLVSAPVEPEPKFDLDTLDLDTNNIEDIYMMSVGVKNLSTSDGVSASTSDNSSGIQLSAHACLPHVSHADGSISSDSRTVKSVSAGTISTTSVSSYSSGDTSSSRRSTRKRHTGAARRRIHAGTTQLISPRAAMFQSRFASASESDEARRHRPGSNGRSVKNLNRRDPSGMMGNWFDTMQVAAELANRSGWDAKTGFFFASDSPFDPSQAHSSDSQKEQQGRPSTSRLAVEVRPGVAETSDSDDASQVTFVSSTSDQPLLQDVSAS